MTTGAQLPEVHVVFPKGQRTGGPEALHQLVHAIRATTDRRAAVVAHPDTAGAAAVEEFRHYECPEATFSEHGAEASLVVPEIFPAIALEARYARRAIWWLSIDNSPAFYSVRGWLREHHGPRRWRDLPRVVVRVSRAARLRRRLRGDSELVHLFQSDYARETVLRRLGKRGHMLSDYVMTTAVADAKPQDRHGVAYNPAKGGAVVEQVRQLLPDVQFTALVDMTPGEVAFALARSAIYLDAGHHPGKDRIPREACLHGCAVLVGRKGSGANDRDVPIPDQHKFSVDQGPESIASLVRECLRDLGNVIGLQQPYRGLIERERPIFEGEVRHIFGCGGDG